MDPAKISFLFGRVPEGFDIEDPDDRAELVALDDDAALPEAQSALRAIVAEQIVSENPPVVWATAQRLLEVGIERRQVMVQLALALTHTAKAALEGGSPDPDAYETTLGWLPLPTSEEIEATALEVVRADTPVASSEVEQVVLLRLGRPEPDPLSHLMVDHVFDRMIDDDGPFALLAGDRTVHVGDLTSGIVLTHRLSESERDLDVLTGAFDLAGFSRHEELWLPDGSELEVFSERGHLAWYGPAEWLKGFDARTLLAVRLNGDGVVSLDLVQEEPPLDPELVALVRAVYDEEVAEPWLPVSGEDLVLGVLSRDPTAFARPRPPLDALCAAAGLERRAAEVAHEESVWDSQRTLWRLHRVFDALGHEDQQRAAARLLELAEDDEASPDDLRRALADLRDPAVAEFVLEELVAEERAESFSDALTSAAKTARQVGVARWVAALAAERNGEALVAEAHLRLALEADPSSAAIVERCAWYASDRGNASEALRLWRQLPGDRSSDIRTVEPFARRSGPKLGRNDPCWCGSGRKYKTCHPGRQRAVPLPERVGWLCHKATAYLEHSGEGRHLVISLAECRAGGADEESVLEALGDPIVIDTALTDGGWFEQFLEDRGALLPDDEALLAHRWALVQRTVYEVVGVTPGSGVRVRDVRTGDMLDVSEHTFSREVRAMALVCARAVPDGENHQFVGGLFPVAPGTEALVLELCDDEDPWAICEHVGSLYRGPVLETRESEPLVTCTVVLDVPDRDAAVHALDQHYRHDGECWVEMHAISDDEEVLRATLSLDGSRLEVVTHSEPRIERVLGVLREALPGARLVSDERVPLARGELPAPPRVAGPEALLDAGAFSQVQDLIERRWIDESVPALAGLTPRQAAEDPTRRDELRRLIASFPDPGDLPAGAVTMRPARLRELLELDM